MGEVNRPGRPKLVRVTPPKGTGAASKAALVAAASKECEHQTAAPSCERVLVVYGEHAANLYIESTPLMPRTLTPPGKMTGRRSA